MNADDPKFTAYALDELDPAERAAIEAELRAQPALAAELEEMRRFTAQLRGELQAEEGAPLLPGQRAAVLGEAPRVVAGPRAWWRRPWVQSAAAACVIVGVIAGIVVRMELQGPASRVAGAPQRGMKLRMEAEMMKKTDPNDFTLAVPTPVPGLALAAPAASGVIGANGTINISGGTVVAASGGKLAQLQTDGLAASQPASGPPVAALSPAPPASSITAPARATELATGRSVDDAQGLYDAGRYDLAMKRTDQVLQKDPYNTGARKLQEKIREERDHSANLGYAEARGRMLWKVDQGWASPVRRFGTMAGISPSSPAVGRRGFGYDTADSARLAANSLGEEMLQDQPANTEAYDAITDNAFLAVKDQPLSTFSVDVDTASYANVRRLLNGNERPPKGAVRIEELVNYFRYDYPRPEGEDPFSCALEAATCPWQTEHRLVRIGLKGREIKRQNRPAVNLVFLIDVSGSMQPENKLPLVKQSLRLLVDQLNAEDTVAIAVYAGNSGCVLEPTHDRSEMRGALDRLEAGGSTNGAAGIQLAYDLAQRSFKKGGTNRVILCTDGDFNVGITSQSELVSMIQGKAKTGIFLSVFGFGMGNLKDATLEKLADKGNGNYGYIDTLAESRKVFVEQMTGTLFTIAKDVKVQVEFNPTQVAAYRLIGYENRLLAKEDFNDDTKDAGEIGAGHTVTALYEVVPAGKAVPGAPGVDDLKYQGPTVEKSAIRNPKPDASPEMLTVKLRYKQPDGDVSKKLEFPLTDNGVTWEKSSRDFRWAASVASFGLLLRDSPHKGSANWNMTLELATEGKGDDRDGYRAEFVGLVEKAKAVCR